MKHSPGPWQLVTYADHKPAHDHGDWSGEIVDESGYKVYHGPFSFNSLPQKANAHLIAAAPDLLAELQEIVAGWKFIEEGYMRGRKLTDWEKERLSFARAAIAKATDL